MRVLVLPLLLLVLGAARAIPEDMCVFLLATPGSGSTTMLELFKDYSPCEMSGENSGAFGSLAEFDAKIDHTDKMHANAKVGHAQDAWYGVYTRDEVRNVEKALARSVLNPRGRKCWGFKEIRHGRPSLLGTVSFSRDVAFLRSLCAQPRVVIHTRRDIADELSSRIVNHTTGVVRGTRVQWACFETFLGNRSAVAAHGLSPSDASLVMKGCQPIGGNAAVPVAISHTLEDYLEDNVNHHALWAYLGLKKPKNSTGIHSSGAAAR